MKKMILLLFLTCHLHSYGQEKLVKDFDGDKIADTVVLHIKSSRIICRLSTTGFKEIKSMEIDLAGDQNGIRNTKSGFELFRSFMRAGQSSQFRYDPVAKRIQLIGMSEYEMGNATNDGSGEASVNLLTSTYVGEWNYYSETKEKLIKLPKIKQKMVLGKMYLEKFNDQIFEEFLTRSSALYEKQKALANQ